MGLSWTALRLIPRWRGESVKVSVVCFYETEVNSKTVRPFTAQVSTPGDTPCVRKRLSPWNEPLLSPPAWPPCPRAAVPLGGWLESQWLLQCACHRAIMRFAEVIDPWFFIGFISHRLEQTCLTEASSRSAASLSTGWSLLTNCSSESPGPSLRNSFYYVFF